MSWCWSALSMSWPRLRKLVQQIMENAFQLKVPLETEARSGKNWGEMSPL